MRFERAYVPAGGAWSSPFVRWQGSLAEVDSLDLATYVTTRALRDRGIDPAGLGRVVLGMTVIQELGFYGAPTLAARIGAPGISGPMLSQACATSALCVEVAASEVEVGQEGDILAVASDRCSNGPLLLFPSAAATGGAPRSEHWVIDNFGRDPWTSQ